MTWHHLLRDRRIWLGAGALLGLAALSLAAIPLRARFARG